MGPPWLWPLRAAGEPTQAQTTVRVPASGLIRLKAPSPTKLSLVFSLHPLDGSAPPGRSAERPTWLKQIILREAELDPAGKAVAADAQGDRNGEITITELDSYLTKRVHELTDGAQTPIQIRPAQRSMPTLLY